MIKLFSTVTSFDKQNGENKLLNSNNSSGHRGVFFRKYLKSKPYSVSITNNRKSIHVGYFFAKDV